LREHFITISLIKTVEIIRVVRKLSIKELKNEKSSIMKLEIIMTSVEESEIIVITSKIFTISFNTFIMNAKII
jgi:hypothetical protein